MSTLRAAYRALPAFGLMSLIAIVFLVASGQTMSGSDLLLLVGTSVFTSAVFVFFESVLGYRADQKLDAQHEQMLKLLKEQSEAIEQLRARNDAQPKLKE